MKTDEKFLVLVCPNCDNWEEQPADQQRSHLSQFTFQIDKNTYDKYLCNNCFTLCDPEYLT